jgi:hypothetical protein
MKQCTLLKNHRSFVSRSKQIGLEVRADKTKYMVMSRYQNAGRSRNTRIGNSSFEFRYLETTLTNQNSIQEEIKSILKLGNACYHSVQNLLSSSLTCNNLKIKTYRTLILPVFYGYETWSFTLREDRSLRVFENRVLRGIFGTKTDEVTG